MSFLYHWVLSWSVMLYGAIGLGGAGLMASWLLPKLHPLKLIAKLAGATFIAIALYLAGYQSADDRAQHERDLAVEREKTRLTALQRDSALRDLGAQRIAAEAARAERDALAQNRSELQQKVADYEEAERRNADREAAGQKAPCNCDGAFISDRDVRWRRSLRPPK